MKVQGVIFFISVTGIIFSLLSQKEQSTASYNNKLIHVYCYRSKYEYVYYQF